MTTYSYAIELSDSEMIALTVALNEYEKLCRKEWEREPRAPYFAHLSSFHTIRAKLYANVTQMSGYVSSSADGAIDRAENDRSSADE